MSRSLVQRFDLPVPMRDGVRLALDLYLPPDGPAGGPYPVIVKRTPYNKRTRVQVKYLVYLAQHGYACAIVDMRGRHESEGVWRPWVDDGRDGHDTLAWVADQPWCNGTIGTLGSSYPGWAQWAAARERPPGLVTMVAGAAAGVLPGRNGPHSSGGVGLTRFRWLHLLGHRSMHDPSLIDWDRVYRHLPLRTLGEAIGVEYPVWREWLDHPTIDDYWRDLVFSDNDFAAIDIPVCHITGWYDTSQRGTLFYWEGMKRSPAAADQRMWLGPWDHNGTVGPVQHYQGVDFGPRISLEALHLRWYDHWLKGIDSGIMDGPPVHHFQMGDNRWRRSDWPPPSTPRAWYPAEDGTLAATPGNAASVTYRYDPDNPVSLFVDPSGTNTIPPIDDIVLDRQSIEARSDVVTFTSAPLDEELCIAGSPKLSLLASSDGLDTDWFCWIADVHPDGRSIAISDGQLRARFRDGWDSEALLTPGEETEFFIEMAATSHRFAAGHCIRLAITSSNFPWSDRNPNTGNPIGSDTTVRVATNTIQCGATHISVPVVPAEDA